MSSDGIRIARGSADAALPLTDANTLFSSARVRGPNIIQRGVASVTLNSNESALVTINGRLQQPGTTIPITDQGYIPIILINRIDGNNYYSNEFVAGGSNLYRQSAWYSAWTYEITRTSIRILGNNIYDINGRAVNYVRNYQFVYYVFDAPLGVMPSSPVVTGGATARLFAGTRAADGQVGMWVTQSGFDARQPQARSAYLLSTSDAIGVGQILARGSFTVAGNSSATYSFGYDFAPYVPSGYVAASAGIDAYELGPTAFIAQTRGLNSPFMTVYSNAVVITNPNSLQASGAWFVMRA